MTYLKRIADYYDLSIGELLACYAIGLLTALILVGLWQFVSIAERGVD